MELRYKEVDRARNIFERYVRCIPTVKSWVRYAKFEMKEGEVARARRCYERAVEELGDDAQTVSFRFHAPKVLPQQRTHSKYPGPQCILRRSVQEGYHYQLSRLYRHEQPSNWKAINVLGLQSMYRSD